MISELIVIHIGQAGVQIGNAFWEQLCVEHGINPDGDCASTTQDNLSKSFFEEVKSGKYIPRVIFLDSEPTVIDEIRSGAYKQLYHPAQLISLKEDAANNFARGSFFIGQQCVRPFRAVLLKLMEDVDNHVCILFFHSICGGSGSGTGALLLQQIILDFPKAFTFQIGIHPSNILANAIVEPYNALFHIHSSIESSDMSLIFDNESFYKISQSLLNRSSPTYNDINKLVSVLIQSITSTKQCETSIYNDLSEICTNLVPYPRIHYPTASYAPITQNCILNNKIHTLEAITRDAFAKSHQTVEIDMTQGKYLSVMLNYKGLISADEVSKIITNYKKSNISFVEWCPTGIKLSINQICPSRIANSDIAYSDKSVTMLCNSTAIKVAWNRLINKFELLFYKRSFVHWYLNDGMEEGEFSESLMDIKLLCDDYEEIALSESDILEILEKYPERKRRTLSVI